MTFAGPITDRLRCSRFLRAARYAWLSVVVAAAVWLIAMRGGDMAALAAAYSPAVLLGSLTCVLGGKCLVLEQMRLSVAASGHRINRSDAAYVYSMSDLSKYLPGGVWGIVGRAGLYRFRRLTGRQIAVALVLENLWLVGGAFLIGAAMSFETLVLLLDRHLGWPIAPRIPRLGLVGVFLGALFLTNVAACRLVSCRLALWQVVYVTLLQLVTWILLGLSFGLLVPASRIDDLLTPAIGAFSVAFGASLVSVFAPAGLGVREAVVTVLLHDLLTLDVLIVMTVVNRFVWITADFAFALCAFSARAVLSDRTAR